MNKNLGQSWTERRTRKRAQELWSRILSQADGLSLRNLIKLRSDAVKLADTARQFSQVASNEIGKSLAKNAEIAATKRADWAWRPEVFFHSGCVHTKINPTSGQELGSNLTLHHDAKNPEMIVRQTPTLRSTNLAPFDFVMEVYDFEGSFLSLAFDLPDQALDGLSNQNIFEMDLRLSTEHTLPIFARINVQHGPNVGEQIKEITELGTQFNVEFDLGYMNLNENRLEKVWIDLIFDDAQMNKIVLHDVTICRRLRAQF